MARDLIKQLPKYYRGSTVMALILATDEAALSAAEAVINDTDNQCLVGTASSALSRWESIFGIPNSEDPDERRRERILAKKRGGGTGTIAHLKKVISSFSNGEVEIAELYGSYMIKITFVGQLGVPPFLDDVKAAIDEIIPAHIGYSIVIAYRTWSDIADRTWADIAGKSWNDIAEGEL